MKLSYCFFIFLFFSSFAFAQQVTDCDKFPNSVACSPMTPVTPSDVPSRTVDIQLRPGATFSSSGCPANVSMSFRGSQMVLINMGTACTLIDRWVRPIMLLIAAITAIFIVLPSED